MATFSPLRAPLDAPAPSLPGHVYAGFTSGDVLRSTDGGENWTRLDLELPAVNDLCCTEI